MANLVTAMGTMDTVMVVSDTSGFTVNGGVILIDSEQIKYTTATDRELIGLTRGYHGTTAATHTVGTSLTVVESAPFVPVVHILEAEAMSWPSVLLTDPSAVPSALVIDMNEMIMVTMTSGGTNQTWTLPLISSPTARLLVVGHASASAKTLTVNTVSITAGTSHTFVWSGTEWLA